MAKWKKQAHVVYQCSYHIVWCPKYRYRILKGEVAKFMEGKIRRLCEWKNVEILEMNVREDHIHMVVSTCDEITVASLGQKITLDESNSSSRHETHLA
jgi:putative transposase